MKIEDQFRIPAPREDVFRALNDSDVLARAIPGCQALEKKSDTEFTATVVTKVGPVKAKFLGSVSLSDIKLPESYTISGEGKAGPVGFAKGSATVRLEEDQGGTLLIYEVNADVGGKLAQLGGRLIEATSKKLAREFFQAFEEIVTCALAEPAAAEEVVEEAGPKIPGVAWAVVVLAALGLAAYLLLK